MNRRVNYKQCLAMHKLFFKNKLSLNKISKIFNTDVNTVEKCLVKAQVYKLKGANINE